MVEWIDLKTRNKILRTLYTILLLAILSIQAYLIFKVYPEERKLFKECEIKTLCYYGQIPENLCYGYKYGNSYSPNPSFNIPESNNSSGVNG